jgi:hypothetical protein
VNVETPSAQPPARPPEGGAPIASTAVRAHSRLIATVRRHQRDAAWLEGFLWGAAAAVGVVPLAVLVSLASFGAARTLLWLAVPVGLAVFAWRGPWQARRTVGDEAKTARLIGERLPALSLDLLAALELERELTRTPAFSRELATAFLDQMDRRAEAVDARALVRRDGAKWGALALAGALLLLLLGTTLRPKFFSRATQPQGPAAAEVREPITGDVELTYRYPAYTGLSMRVLPNTTGEIAAPAGTEVTLRTRADRPVERALIVVNGQKVPLQVAQQRELTGRLVLKQSGNYHFQFESSHGKVVAEGPDTTVTVQPDNPPQVNLLSPAEEIEVSPKQPVTIEYDAQDDYGITDLALVYRIAGDSTEHHVALRHDEGRHSSGRYRWNLDELALPPGTRLTYDIEAIDNDEVAGKKKGVSRTHTIKLYSAEEHRRAALQKAQQLWDRLVDHLAHRMEGPDRGGKLTAQTVGTQSSLDVAGEQLASDFLEAARALGKEFAKNGRQAVPPELIGALLNVGDGMKTKVRATSDARRLYLRLQDRFPEIHPGDRIARAVSAEIAEAEKDVLYLESMLDRQKLEELRQLSRELASDRRDLANLIEQFQKTHDKGLQEQILRKVSALKQRMAELMKRMGELSKGIRDEHLNAEALQKMAKDQDMLGGMEQVEKLLREGKTEEALKKLQQLGMEMDKLSQQLGDAENKAGSEQYAELRQKMQQFAQKLGDTAKEQKDVAEKTRSLRDKYRQQQLERIRKQGQALQKELLQETEALQKDFQKQRNSRLGTRAGAAFDQLQSDLENLKNALQRQEYDLASESADHAEMSAGELAAMGQQQAQLDRLFQNAGPQQEQSERNAQQLAQGEQRTRKIAEKLHSLFPPPQSMMSGQDQKQLQQLGQKQRKLEQQAQQLQQQMHEMSQQAPVFGKQGEEQLQTIGEQMGQAAERIEGHDPGRGYAQQQAAMDGLQQLQQQMQQQGGGGGGGGMPLPMFGGQGEEGGDSDQSQEKVEIPEQDASESTREFRKDLMDAMKQGVPDKYRQQVKDYYEELVK